MQPLPSHKPDVFLHMARNQVLSSGHVSPTVAAVLEARGIDVGKFEHRLLANNAHAA